MTPGNWQSITFSPAGVAPLQPDDDVTTSARAVAYGTTTPAQLMSTELHGGMDARRQATNTRMYGHETGSWRSVATNNCAS